MKSIKKGLLLMFLGLYYSSALAAASPARNNNPEDVVSSLYRDFGWELRDYEGSQRILIDQSVAVLERYFTQKLAKLIAKDRQYVSKTKEIGHIDFVLLSGSQDPAGISNIRIAKEPGTDAVDVLYDQDKEKDVMKIVFDTMLTKSGWRISDIHYKERKSTAFPDPIPEYSLLQLLSQPY